MCVVEDLSKQVRARREGRGLSRSELAALCGLSVSTIKNIEARKHVPEATTLKMIEKALECDLSGAVEPTPLSSLVAEMLSLVLKRVTMTALVDAVVAVGMDRRQLAVALLQRVDAM